MTIIAGATETTQIDILICCKGLTPIPSNAHNAQSSVSSRTVLHVYCTDMGVYTYIYLAANDISTPRNYTWVPLPHNIIQVV